MFLTHPQLITFCILVKSKQPDLINVLFGFIIFLKIDQKYYKTSYLFLGLVTKQLWFVGSITCQSISQLLCLCMCLRLQHWPALDNVLCQKGHLSNLRDVKVKTWGSALWRTPWNQDSSSRFPLRDDNLLSLLFYFTKSLLLASHETQPICVCLLRLLKSIKMSMEMKATGCGRAWMCVCVCVCGADSRFEFLSSTKIKESTQPPCNLKKNLASILSFAF